MKTWIFLYVAFLGVYCAPTLKKDLTSEWTLFKRIHNKHYKSSKEESARRVIWETNLATIQEHNLEANLGLHTFTLAMNRFGDMTNKEFRKQMNGLRATAPSKINFDSHTFLPPANVVLPDAVDWRKQGYVTPVKDQEECGSCWAFSSTGALEGQHFAKSKQLVSLSEQNLLDCSDAYGNTGCEGGLMHTSFQYVKENKGIDTESSYPYEAVNGTCRFKKENVGATDTGYVNITEGSEADLQAAIATVGPIAVGIDASDIMFQFYGGGVYYNANCSTTDLDHAVLAVGYGTYKSKEYYIIKNSWGTIWGDDGYIWMSRNRQNNCGIASQAIYPLV